jgi:hypothetical protein
MILYTTMPQELIFQTDPSEYEKQKIVQYEGIPLLVSMDEGQSCTVLRVMSSDPNHFMNEKCTPGSKITLSSL